MLPRHRQRRSQRSKELEEEEEEEEDDEEEEGEEEEDLSEAPATRFPGQRLQRGGVQENGEE